MELSVDERSELCALNVRLIESISIVDEHKIVALCFQRLSDLLSVSIYVEQVNVLPDSAL